MNTASPCCRRTTSRNAWTASDHRSRIHLYGIFLCRIFSVTRLLVTLGAVAALHAAAVVLLFLGSAGGGQPLVLGLVLTAYLAGVKHSYDWDHIAAIDNSTRKFVAEHKDPVSVGFAFSLGHCSVVVLAGALLVAGASLVGGLMTEGSAGNTALGLIGSGVSGGLFLLAMGIFNGSAFLQAVKAYRRACAGQGIDAGDLEAKGFVARLLARPLSRVQRPGHIYVIGFLFGLGCSAVHFGHHPERILLRRLGTAGSADWLAGCH